MPGPGKPVTPIDLFGGFQREGRAPVTSSTVPQSRTSFGYFNPKEYEFVHNASSLDNPEDLARLNAQNQPLSSVIGRSLTRFGANAASSFGQGLANTFDLFDAGKTFVNEFTEGQDDFGSSFFGISTRDMQKWADKVAANNPIYEKEQGSFNPLDMGWWGNQFASSGTGVGMAVEALATTALIESITGGTGTAAALGKLGSVFSKLRKAENGAAVIAEAMGAAKGMKSAATMYGVISRLSESRMEAMQTYDAIYNDLKSQKNEDGSPKFTDEQAKDYASKGARKDFNYNLALLPLDILSYRTMVFNPISGSAEGAFERGLASLAGKFGSSRAGKAAGWLATKSIGVQAEGLEEGFQHMGQTEGEHYAKVLSGEDDGSSFISRLGQNVKSDEFWNNYAGGVIGAPIIGGAMNVINNTLHGRQKNRLAEVHQRFLRDMGKANSALAQNISEQSDNPVKAAIGRRKFSANQALGALHLDAMTDKDTAFNSRTAFINGVLNDINTGKTDALEDLGFDKDALTPEVLQTIKQEFEQYAKDGEEMKSIYDTVKFNYNKNFVPEIAEQQFTLNRLQEQKSQVDNSLAQSKLGLAHFGELAPQGQMIFDTEYRLRALQEEQARITEAIRETKDTRHKTYLEDILADNKAKMTQINEQLDTIYQDTAYTPDQRKKDNDVLQAAATLRDTNYQQSVYDSEALGNQITLQRKKLAAWNDKQYINQRTSSLLNKATTTQQVDDNKEANPTQATEKAAAITAKQEAATELAADQQSVGNQDLFGANLNHISSILSATQSSQPVQTVVNENGGTSPVVASFSPDVYDFNQAPDDAKRAIINGVKGILDTIGNQSSFEDLVRYVSKASGRDTADKIYNSLKYGWEGNGREAVDYDAVYTKIFGNPLDTLIAGHSQAFESVGQKNKQADDILKDSVSKQDGPVTFDNNNKPVYVYPSRVQSKGVATFAYSSRLVDMTLNQNDDGTVSINYAYTEEELNKGGVIDSIPLLDPDTYTPGTELEIRMPANANDILIPIYNSDGTRATPITFGQYVAQNNLNPNDQAFKDKFPMIIFDPSRPKGLAFVHDIEWYNNIKFLQTAPEEMAKAIENTRRIREEVLSNGVTKPTTITITGKRQTNFDGLKTKVISTTENGEPIYEMITLKDANPETTFGLVMGNVNPDSVFVGKNQKFQNDNRKIGNSREYKYVGEPLEIRRFGTEGGIPTYNAYPIFREPLDQDASGSILRAMNIYATQNAADLDAPTKAKYQAAAKAIREGMGIDILTPVGLEQYLKHFITVNPVRGVATGDESINEKVEKVAKAASTSLTRGTPYLQIEKGIIIFGKAGIPSHVDSKTGKPVLGNYIAKTTNSSIARTGIAKFGNPNEGFITWYRLNLNLEAVNSTSPFITIGADYGTKTEAPTYRDYLLSKFKTNIRSYNIGTKEKPNYVTNIQPIIEYDTNSHLASLQKQESVEEVKEEVVKPIEEASTQDTQLDDEAEEARRIAREMLGDDFNPDEVSYSPDLLEDEDRQYVSANINRIDGLTTNQQNQVTNFIFNNIVQSVDANNGRVVVSEINSKIDTLFSEVIEAQVLPLKAQLLKFQSSTNAEVQKVANAFKQKIAKIEAIKNQLPTLKEEAMRQVQKFTNIKANRTEQEEDTKEQNEENDAQSNDIDGEGQESTRDFWTDVLTENPESKLSYAMRRFFTGVREYNKDGSLKKGFLDLPAYLPSDVVIRTLMVNLANTPADFDLMIAKLDKIKDSTPWMQGVIDKLKTTDNQKKAQFVTVMSNTPLRMKFTMISFNRRSGTWTTKAWDTNLNGVADSIRDLWEANSKDGGLVAVNNNGDYILDTEEAQKLLNEFKQWTGVNMHQITSDMTPYTPIIRQVTADTKMVFEPKGDLLKELQENLKEKSDRVQFYMNRKYQISDAGNGKYRISAIEDTNATREQRENWLKKFGIVLSPRTWQEFEKDGLYHNYMQRSYKDQFAVGNTNGLFGILANKLQSLINKGGIVFSEEGDRLLDDSVVTSLANLEAKYNESVTPFGFRDNGKSYFALTAPKFITERISELKDINSTTLADLQQLSFSQNSLWLTLLKDDRFRDKFDVYHVGANALKELGKRLYRDNAINKLSNLDHEVTKLGLFWDTKQGEVRYGKSDSKKYPDTQIEMRMATMFSPTMSDKHIMTLIKTAVLNLDGYALMEGKVAGQVHDDVKKILYEQLVKPELARMIKFHQNGGSTNISAYDKGAAMFLLLPEMNNIMISPTLRLVDAIKNEPNTFTLDRVEPKIKESAYNIIQDYVTKLVEEKKQSWMTTGIVEEFVMPNRTEYKLNYVDKEYLAKFDRYGTEAKVNMAAADFVINSLITNANSFMTIIGDPALYYKSKSSDALTKAMDTFDNVGKRLANQIAPGTPISSFQNDKYLQIFIKDRESIASNIKYLERILGVEGAKAYREIEGADGQEYTTWKEHLDILARMGKSSDAISDVTADEIQQARELFASGVSSKDLSEKQMELIGKVMQPIKPVYTGQIYDKEQDVMRTMYIKCSSFPLIPQLTEGLEIDKLRVAMEKLQADNKNKRNVRASHQSANKVGSSNAPLAIWNDDGTINDKELNRLFEGTPEGGWLNHSKGTPVLELDRKGFRIQQEIPFKSGKKDHDEITLGTQIMKLLFGDAILNETGFVYNGKEYTGKQLHAIYNNHFINLVKTKKKQLFDELGLNNDGSPIDQDKTLEKLQRILKDEAEKRGYPLQDIEGLGIDQATGQFTLPLWASSNANRYESMLNSIITNRIIRMKMPGYSYVVGSEEGFKKKVVNEGDLDPLIKSKIVFTSAWNGSELQATELKEDGSFQKAQVFVPSKFRLPDGTMIDLFTKENGEYIYIKETPQGLTLNEDKFDKDLLTIFGFRIPTSGLQSGATIEIAGFLPYQNGDLMVVPKTFTKQMGLDFDIDKQNTYQFHHYRDNRGKFAVLSEEHRNEILTKVEAEKSTNRLLAPLIKQYNEATNDRDRKFILDHINDVRSEGALVNSLFSSVEFTPEDIVEGNLTKLNDKISEQLIQNELVKIYHSVYSNPKDNVQKKILANLGTKFVEDEAKFIEGLIGGTKDNKHWTPLSDEYQKSKLISGASGKIGTGAYSLDVVGHSLFQQVSLTSRPIALKAKEKDEDGNTRIVDKVMRFGNIVSESSRLGLIDTLDGGRSISSVLAERQNMAVDNEKLQVMGKVGINDFTLDVDKAITLLGFDKGEDEHSISMLFLSQPIIREFTEAMKNANSNLVDYNPNRQDEIIDALKKKYGLDSDLETFSDYEEVMSKRLTNANMIEAIKNSGFDGELQVFVLNRFLELKGIGESIRSIQTAINTDSKGLGKSFFDVIARKEALNRLGGAITVAGYPTIIVGASNLVGQYVDPATDDIDIEDLNSGEYIDIGEWLVKPNTLTGAFNVIGVTTAYNLWSKYFPYDTTVTQSAFNELMPIIGNGDNMGDSKQVELKQDVFKNLRKYLSTNNNTGILSSTDDINYERSRLFIDTDENVSLAKYIKTIRTRDTPEVNEFIRTNKLINRFEYDINTNGQPSLIKFNNAAGEEYDEQYLYDSLANLIEKQGPNGRIQLPTVGNKSYTLDTLAQDIVAYVYIANATQEAIQFTKYVPVSYLNVSGYSGSMRTAHLELRDNFNVINGYPQKTPEQYNLVSEFTMQYIQHNPERVRAKYDAKKFFKDMGIIYADNNNLSLLQTFTVSPDKVYKPTFVSVYDSAIKDKKKFHLFWYDGTKYTRIPVLGVFGMDEYQKGYGIGKSIVNGKVKVNANPQAPVNQPSDESAQDPFKISTGSVATVVDSIAKSDLGYISILANAVLPYLDPKVTIQYSTEVNGKTAFKGSFTHTDNVIHFNPDTTSNNSMAIKARVIMEEVIHSLTANQIKPYIKQNPSDHSIEVLANAPAYVSDLVRLYNNVIAKADTTKLQEVLKTVAANQKLTPEQYHKYYGLTDIFEFMALSLSEPKFQEYLAGEEFKQSGSSLLERLKAIIQNILNSLGVRFDSDTAAAQAIGSVFEFIKEENPNSGIPPSDQDRFNSAFNNDYDGDFDPNNDPFVDSFSPDIQDFPTKKLDIREQNCL